MRVTDNYTRKIFANDLQSINERVAKSRLKYTSGEELLSTSDNPEALVTAKKYKSLIERNEHYTNLIKSTIEERTTAESKLETISGNMQKLRDIAVDTTQIGNTPNFATLSNYIKGLLTDMLRDANGDHNGKYLFSGTKTTPESIKASSATGGDKPFELIQGAATAANPSGMSIAFYGNYDKRTINRDDTTEEQINATAIEAFGGTDAFDSVIDMYNLIKYNSSGTERGTGDGFTPDEVAKVNDLQKKLAQYADRINSTVSKGGEQILRFGSIADQLTNDNARIDEYRSRLEEADVARAALDLSRDENALQYALKAGAGISQISLFDFLS